MATAGVTTGQSPKRRETDADALKRDRILSVRAFEREDAALLDAPEGAPMTRDELARWHLTRARRGRR